MARRRGSRLQLPITVRQAQKLARRRAFSLVRTLGLPDSYLEDEKGLHALLARIAAKYGPNTLLTPESFGSGEFCPGNTIAGQATAKGPGSPGGGGQQADAAGPGDGDPTSSDSAPSAHSFQPAQLAGQGSSTALDPVSPQAEFYSDEDSTSQPRDAGGAGTRSPSDGDGLAAQTTGRVHVGKWSKRFPRGPNSGHGGITVSMGDAAPPPSLVQRARLRLAELVGGEQQGPRWDHAELCRRLWAGQSPHRARREDDGWPVLWVLADVSGSCSPFSAAALRVARACGALGIPGADILVCAHSNGHPEEWELNGRPCALPVGEPWPAFEVAARRLPPRLIIALGDWDAASVYHRLALWPGVERLLWLDGHGPRGQDQTAWLLTYLGDPRLRGRVRYLTGCQGEAAFVDKVGLT